MAAKKRRVRARTLDFSDLRPLIRGILANPLDWGAVEVCSDCVEEQGRVTPAYVLRGQAKLAAARSAGEAVTEHEVRVDRLIDMVLAEAGCPDWRGCLTDRDGPLLTVDGVSVPEAADRGCGLAETGLVKRVNLWHPPGAGAEEYRRLAESGFLAWVPELGLPDYMEAAHLEALVQSPNLYAVERLYVECRGLTTAGVRALAGPLCFPGLRGLSMTGQRVGPTHGEALRAGGLLRRLAELDLSRTRLGPRGLAAVLGGVSGRLEALSLRDLGLGEAEAGLLAGCPRLGGLRTLDLAGNRLTDAATGRLAGSRYLAGLRVLDLGYTSSTAAGVGALLGSPHLARCRISLRLDRPTPAWAAHLAQEFGDRLSIQD